MKLMTLRVPKISDNPAATKNRSMPLISPPVVCVTRHDVAERHASSACRSKVCSESRMACRNLPQRDLALRRCRSDSARAQA